MINLIIMCLKLYLSSSKPIYSSILFLWYRSLFETSMFSIANNIVTNTQTNTQMITIALGCLYISVFDKLIWCTIGLKSLLICTAKFSPFLPDGTVNYDYIVTNSINALLISSRCLPNGIHTNYC